MNKIYAIVMIVKTYDTILGTTKKNLVVYRDGKVYGGALFFPLSATHMITEVIASKYVEGTTWDVIEEAYCQLKVNGMLAKDDSTLLTMLHWQYINGFSSEMFIDIYEVKNDTEYLAKRKGE